MNVSVNFLGLGYCNNHESCRNSRGGSRRETSFAGGVCIVERENKIASSYGVRVMFHGMKTFEYSIGLNLLHRVAPAALQEFIIETNR